MEVLSVVKYQQLKQIGVGEGRNSTVYLGTDTQHGGEIAVKEIPKADLIASGITDYYSEAKAMFASGSNEPANVVPIRYAGEDSAGDVIRIVMPYFRRGSLQGMIVDGPIPPAEAIRVGLEMLNGLQNIHNAGYIHFDLKPSNVLITNSSHAMVADFGQARLFNPRTGFASAPGMYVAGMPPECFGSSGLGDQTSDIFQAGSTLYRAVNGNPHFALQRPRGATLPALIRNAEKAVKSGKFPDRDSFFPHVPERLKRAIRKALNIDPTDRFQSAAEFAAELEKVALVYRWSVAIRPNGEITWTGEHSKLAKLQVDLLHDGATDWKVRCHTVGAQKRERKAGGWRADGMSIAEAFRHLRTPFQQLERS